MPVIDRAIAAYLGLAIGDALGAISNHSDALLVGLAGLGDVRDHNAAHLVADVQLPAAVAFGPGV